MMTRILFALVLFAFVGGNILSWVFGSGIRVSFLDLAALALAILFFSTSLKRIRAIKMYLTVFGPFTFAALISLLLQINHLTLLELGTSSLYLWRFVMYSLLTVVIAFTEDMKKWALTGLWFGGVLLAILGLLQYYFYPNLRNLSYLGWDPHQYRVFSTLFDPNFSGIILVLTLVLSARMIQHKNTLWRNFAIVASGLTFISLLLTYSRGSYFALLTTGMSWVVITKQWKRVAVILVLFLGLLFLLPRPGGEGVHLTRTISIISRIEDSQEALGIFSKSPLLGVGFDTLRFIRGERATRTEDVSHSGAGYHNSWLFILATTGIIGFAAYGWIWWKLIELALDKELLLVFFAAVGIHSLFDNSLFFPWVMVWLWVVAGVLLKVDRSPSARS